MTAMPRTSLSDIRQRIYDAYLADEKALTRQLMEQMDLTGEARQQITEDAAEFVRNLRRDANAGLMETFLSEWAEYRRGHCPYVLGRGIAPCPGRGHN